jgi:methylmalonyl-CoA mutase
MPFDYSYKTPDEFSERIARNQQLLLKEESHFNKIVDPGAGSYYIEKLTDSIAEQAWKIFLTIEEKGGFYATLKEGYVQKEIKATSQARFEAVAKRRETLLGTNQFPNFNEQVAGKIEPYCDCGCGGLVDCECGDSCECNVKEGALETLDFRRGAIQFEKLRLATEKSGKRPKVFMLTIGNLAMRLARAQFSSNFFACAGYEIIDNLGFQTAAEGVAAARKAKAGIIVICSSDEEYAEFAPQAFEAIGGGKEIFVVAGAPECTEELKAKGIANFISVRSNVLETLQSFNKQLGIN